jgi:hypothetical protein
MVDLDNLVGTLRAYEDTSLGIRTIKVLKTVYDCHSGTKGEMAESGRSRHSMLSNFQHNWSSMCLELVLPQQQTRKSMMRKHDPATLDPLD